MEKRKKSLDRWAENNSEFLKDRRRDHNVMKQNFAGPPTMKNEIVAAMRKMKSSKATGPDSISVELLEALEDYGIDKITTLLNQIYDSGHIPPDISKSIFRALPKKPGATECELHRTISLIRQTTKIHLRIIMMRVRKKIKPEIAEEQYGFMEKKDSINASYTLQTINELWKYKKRYICASLTTPRHLTECAMMR